MRKMFLVILTLCLFVNENIAKHHRPTIAQCTNDRRLSFCEHVDNYPQQLIQDLLKQDREKYESYLFKDSLGMIMGDDDDDGDDADDDNKNRIQGRFGGVGSTENLCDSTTKIYYPKSGETSDGNWATIVNDDKQQPVEVELCNKTTSCQFTDNFPMDVQSKCIQNYTFRPLLGLDGNNQLKMIYFKFPMCCQCKIMRGRS